MKPRLLLLILGLLLLPVLVVSLSIASLRVWPPAPAVPVSPFAGRIMPCGDKFFGSDFNGGYMCDHNHHFVLVEGSFVPAPQ